MFRRCLWFGKKKGPGKNQKSRRERDRVFRVLRRKWSWMEGFHSATFEIIGVYFGSFSYFYFVKKKLWSVTGPESEILFPACGNRRLAKILLFWQNKIKKWHYNKARTRGERCFGTTFFHGCWTSSSSETSFSLTPFSVFLVRLALDFSYNQTSQG